MDFAAKGPREAGCDATVVDGSPAAFASLCATAASSNGLLDVCFATEGATSPDSNTRIVLRPAPPA